jgi:hypothetical protein
MTKHAEHPSRDAPAPARRIKQMPGPAQVECEKEFREHIREQAQCEARKPGDFIHG